MALVGWRHPFSALSMKLEKGNLFGSENLSPCGRVVETRGKKELRKKKKKSAPLKMYCTVHRTVARTAHIIQRSDHSSSLPPDSTRSSSLDQNSRWPPPLRSQEVIFVCTESRRLTANINMAELGGCVSLVRRCLSVLFDTPLMFHTQRLVE